MPKDDPDGHALDTTFAGIFDTGEVIRGAPRVAASRDNALENALDLLADGIALLGLDGRIVYANEALRLLLSQQSDVRVVRNAIEFATSDLRLRFAAALRAVARSHDPAASSTPTDFAVPRDDGLPPYTVFGAAAGARAARGGRGSRRRRDAAGA